jgi:diguanylate cyclase (GGDEF)-like protein/PAS domain S-box-containing protein
MKPSFFQSRSIKTRVTLFTLGIFLLSLWLLMFYASRILRTDMQHMLSDQQFSTATFVAEDINHELGDRLSALESVAAGISPAAMGNAAALQTKLENRPVLASLFNAGVTVVAPDGTALADVPRSNGRIGVNYSKIDYVAANLKEGKAMIGKPIIGPTLKAPVVGMGVPIRDTHGNVIGALSGVTNLGKPSFLDVIAQGHYGKTGGYLLAAPQYRLIVTASDKWRIMEEFPAPGIDPVIDARVGGKESTELFVNPRGVQVLSSAKTVPVAGWFVVVSLPSEEAFAPIRDVERRSLLATLLLALLAGGLTWWMLRSQLAPMLDTVKSLAVLAQSDQHPMPLSIVRHDEIGKLIAGFNHLLIELGQRGDALRESEARYSMLIQNIGEGICFVDIGEQFIFANPAAEGIFGVPPGGLVGHSLRELTTPEQYSLIEEQTRRRQAGETGTYEHEIYRADGQLRRLLVTAVPQFGDQGQFTGAFAVLRDITERKRHEEGLQNFRMAMDASADAIYLVDRSSMRFVDVNEAACRMQSRTREELLALGPDGVLSLPLAELARTYDSIIAGGPGTEPLEMLRQREDGTHVWVELRRRAQRSGADWMIVTTVRDITERKQAEEALRESDVQLQCILESTSDGILAIDHHGKVIRFNQRFGQLWRIPQSLLDNKDDQALLSHVVGQLAEPQEFLSKVQSLYGSDLEATDAISFKDGRVFERFTSPLMLGSSAIGRIWSFRDITERKQLEDQIRQLAFYDPLTELPNRRLLLDRLTHALAESKRSGRYGALMFLDLDNFKALNDTAGHAVGDLLLMQAAKRMKSCVREVDTVARFGGDEFVVMVSDLDTDKTASTTQANNIAEKIRVALVAPYRLMVKHDGGADSTVEHQCSASLGAVVFTQREGSQDDFLRWADAAMYQAKEAGGNVVQFYAAKT